MAANPSLDAVAPILEEYQELEKALSDPNLHADQNRARSVARRYAELGRIVKLVNELSALDDDIAAAAELA